MYENSYCVRRWFRKARMWIHEVDRQKCLGQICSLSFILCFPCQGEHLFQLGIYSNEPSPFSVFWLIPNYLCREGEILRYWVLPADQELEHFSWDLASGLSSRQQHWAWSLLEGCWLCKTRGSWEHCFILFYTWPACGKGRRWFSGWIRWETMCKAAARLFGLWDLGGLHALHARRGKKDI